MKKIPDMKEYGMRGTYEAFILVKVKDGTQFVCALNRQYKRDKGQDDTLTRLSPPARPEFQDSQVIWN